MPLSVNSIDEAIRLAADSGEEEAFIVGGGEIYRQTLDRVDRIYITVIGTDVEGDTFYPPIRFAGLPDHLATSFPGRRGKSV